MTARSELRGQVEELEAASLFCPFALVKRFLARVAKAWLGHRSGSHVKAACPGQGNCGRYTQL